MEIMMILMEIIKMKIKKKNKEMRKRIMTIIKEKIIRIRKREGK